MAFTREMMYYNDYVWSTKYTKDDPRVTGQPDSTLLSRKEGWEMIYFVNKLAQIWGWKDSIHPRSYQKIERSIREYVPSTIRTQKDIQSYIETQYQGFWDKI